MPMSDIRILIVDDSIIVRKLLTLLLAREPGISVVGAARNGLEALAMSRRLKPDLITLDIVMPGMDGLAALEKIRASDRTTKIIMFSTLTARGAEATVDALSKGANDYVNKPSMEQDSAAALESIRRQLVPKIRALCQDVAETRQKRSPSEASYGGLRHADHAGWFPEVVAIGVSTGGPEALGLLLPSLPRDFPVPILVTQHMPALFTKVLAKRLDGRCRIRVEEAGGRQPLKPGQVYLAPGDRHLTVERAGAAVVTRLLDSPPVNSCRPSVDVLLESVARVYSGRALGLILTGMGRDGLEGSRRLFAAGARIWAQDAASSVVWGMPGAVVRAGLAHSIFGIRDMAEQLIRTVGMKPSSVN